MSSDLYVNFDEMTCFINLVAADKEEKSLENKKTNYQITEGDLVLEFTYDCVSPIIR